MKKYKVQFTKTYVFDEWAPDEARAIEKAKTDMENAEAYNEQHYHQTQDMDIVTFDVTNTDDPFNPL